MDLGSQLRVTREQRGLTLEDVSARTKIPRRLLADLERNDVAHWPKQRIYQIGFVRAYATEVGLNAEQAVARFVASCPEQSTEASVTKHEPEPTARPTRKVWLGAAAVVACLCVIFFISIPPPDRAASPGVLLPDAAPHAASDAPLEPGYREATTGTVGLTTPDESADSEIEGELLIESNPSDAWVVVNGIGRGRTPARIQHLPAGSYTIRLVRAGYRSSDETVTLGPEQPGRSLRITLRELVR